MGSDFKQVWRNNGLSIVLFTLFALFLTGQSVTGWLEENSERRDHGQQPIALSAYLQSGSFVEATMENWESEFLQMAAYVLFTIFLYQRGSSESKSPDEEEAVDQDPRLESDKRQAPWPVRRGGWVLHIYEHSLGIAFALLFLMSFSLHAVGGAEAYNEERSLHGAPPIGTLDYLVSSRFWFESFQNWQSEFLAIWSMVVLSIFLRQRGSPESKRVAAPHSETGSE
jgi:Domain of unknown function (DUF6766)